MDGDLRRRVNISYTFYDLVKRFTGEELRSGSIRCPFHEDARPSAKVFKDGSGEKIHCFSEGRQFTISDYLILNGEDLREWDPGGRTLLVDENKEYNYNSLDGFRSGIISINDVFKALLNLRKI